MGTFGDKARQRFALLAVAVVALALVGVGTSSATAAKPKKPEVSLSAPGKAEVGKAFQVGAVVKRGVKGQQITLQRRVGATWTQVASAKLPAKGARKKTVAFSVTPSAAGTQVYRAVLAKKKTPNKTTKGATSPTAQVTVVKPPVVPPETGSGITLTTSTSTLNEQTKVTFSGTVTGLPAGTPVQIQYARGKSPVAAAWATFTTVPTTGDASPLTYAGNITIPVDRVGVVGAPQLNIRAVAGGVTSPTKSYLIRTRYDGTYVMYDENDEIVRQDTFQVIYSDKWWRMNFGGSGPVYGTTDGWDLLDNSNLRFVATYHGPGEVCEGTDAQGDPICIGDADDPWIEYVASFTSGGEDRRIEGLATFERT